MVRDIHNKLQYYDRWKNELTPKYIEEGLSKANTKHLINFLDYLEKRGRSKRTLYENKNKLKAIMKLFQNAGFNDLTKLKEDDVLKFFSEWSEKGHSDDYRTRL